MKPLLSIALLSLALLASSLASGCTSRSEQMEQAFGDGTAVVWTLTEYGYASCGQPASALRRVLGSPPAPVDVFVYYEGLRDDEVRTILTRERLIDRVRLVPIRESQYERLFGGPMSDAVLVIRDAHVVEKIETTPETTRGAVETMLQRHLAQETEKRSRDDAAVTNATRILG